MDGPPLGGIYAGTRVEVRRDAQLHACRMAVAAQNISSTGDGRVAHMVNPKEGVLIALLRKVGELSWEYAR